jgi:arsenate reductase
MNCDSLQAKRVLVICTGNSARSQMAEGLLRHLGGEQVQVFSAGSAPAEQIHSLAVRAMAEIGLDISAQKPKPLGDFLGRPFDYIIAVCSKAAEACPFCPGRAERLHWFYDDPAAVQGTGEAQMAAFRAVRDDMKLRITDWLASMSNNRGPLL